MPIFDDEDESGESPRRGGGRGGGGGERGDSWDVVDDAPDHRDIVPDEYTTVRCTRCRKLIFEDSVSCPYCKTIQLEDHRNKRPLWWIITVLLCIGVLGGFMLLSLLTR